MFKTKQEVREHVWKAIKKVALPPFPVSGRIPNFRGSKKACEKIRELSRYKESKIVFSAPDSPLRRVREIVLEDKKTLLAVKPRMTGFLILDSPSDVSIRGMLQNGREIRENEFDKLGKVDLFIQGCVAVDVNGNRIGKGSGYGDREYKLFERYGLLNDCLFIVIAHDIQVFEDLSHLMQQHDIRADVILTPKRIIFCRNGKEYIDQKSLF